MCVCHVAGNWLADTIARERSDSLATRMHYNPNTKTSQLLSTVHTEFLFFDPQLDPEACPLRSPAAATPSVHVFPDWGTIGCRTFVMVYLSCIAPAAPRHAGSAQRHAVCI